MIDELLSAWLGVPLDDLVGYGLVGLAVLIVVAFPKQFRRSLLRWGGDERPSAPIVQMPVDPVLARIKRLVRPTLLLVPAAEPGFSKLGGEPELPEGTVWPADAHRPRTFLGQIDLAAVAAHSSIEWLPDAGRLYAFYDPDRNGLADVVSVLHGLDPPGPPAPTPKGGKRPFPERRVAFTPLRSAPSFDWLGLGASEVDVEPENLEAIGTAPSADAVQHRIGGYPNEIQPERMWLSCEHLARGLSDPVWDEAIPPAIQRAAKAWRLLLQIDSDPALKMNFGDGGRLYVFIREQHARRGDFSKTVTLWQTY